MLEEERRREGSEEPISPWTDADCNQPSLDESLGWEEEEESASASAGCRLEKKINWEAAAEGGGCFLIQTLSLLQIRTFK